MMVSFPELCVNVTEEGFSVENTQNQQCEIGRNIMFNEKGLVSYCLANWEPKLYDALVVSAAIEFCDYIKMRPKRGWGRRFYLTVPVHNLDLWRDRCVSKTLRDALNFLTGDVWQIDFVERKKQADQPRQWNFPIPDRLQYVMSYSNGLDSYVVWRLMQRRSQNKIILARLETCGLNNGKFNKSKEPFAVLPYRVSCAPISRKEFSGRSRGFKFALLSAIAAYLSKTNKIIVPESGQGALGCSLVPVGHAYPDYRSHPRFMGFMEKFINALFDHPIHYDFPRIWHTKGETLGAYLNEFVDEPSWRKTRSCWQDSRQVSVSGRRRQCGICAACLLRRMSVYAAGQSENKEAYVWEDLNAPRYEDGAASTFKRRQPKGALYEYAIAGVLHLQHIAELSECFEELPSLKNEEFFLSQFFDLDTVETRRRLLRMLRQHGEEWNGFVESLGSVSFINQWAKGSR